MNLPFFKYHPAPLKTGSIKESKSACNCCEKITGYEYSGSMYCRDRPNTICPWCIANGDAHEKFGIEFTSDYNDSDEGWVVANAAYKELFFKTPGFSSFQEQGWQEHCNDLCEFHGLATVFDFKNISEVEKKRLIGVSYLDNDEFEELCKGNDAEEHHYFLKFKCRHCNEIKFSMDLD